MPEIRLLATDLDGTLIGSRDEYDSYEPFRERLRDLSARHDTVWAIFTGRKLSSCRRVLAPMISGGISPDYLTAQHAYIYSVTPRHRYSPHLMWNAHIMGHIGINWIRSQRAIRQCHHAIRSRFRRVKTVCMNRGRLCMRFHNSDAVEAAAQIVRPITDTHANLQMFEYLTDLEIRIIPFTKGLATLELARQLRIPRANILAIGDGLNDISMLDNSVAAMTACPSNARAEVMQVVHETQGHISRSPSLAGVLEAIDAHIAGNVTGALPVNWEDLRLDRQRSGAYAHSIRKRRPSKRGKALREMLIIGAAGGTMLLVLGHFGMLGPLSPYVSRAIHGTIFEVAMLAEQIRAMLM